MWIQKKNGPRTFPWGSLLLRWGKPAKHEKASEAGRKSEVWSPGRQVKEVFQGEGSDGLSEVWLTSDMRSGDKPLGGGAGRSLVSLWEQF